MSSARPPAWKYRVCIRVPATISNRSRVVSRSSNVYQNIEIAPSSSADVPSQTRWEWILVSSERHMRIHVAFDGTSSSRSFSIASTKASSLTWNDT